MNITGGIQGNNNLDLFIVGTKVDPKKERALDKKYF